MIKATLTDMPSNRQLRVFTDIDASVSLGTKTYGEANGHFNAEQRTSAGTTTMIATRGQDAFSLTDIIVTTDKAAGCSFTLDITDGVETETIVGASFADAPVTIALPVKGRLESWRGSRLDLTTVGGVAHTVTVTIGYFRVPTIVARSYAVWDEER
jgi:hypothetical protein